MAERPPSAVMIERVRKLALDYRLDLTEEEIDSIARQSESYERLFRMLHEIDLSGVTPLLKLDLKP
jgi:Asp-tRNA(Asn)/Glu-tRNA(Gln) amidotransferase C subunit